MDKHVNVDSLCMNAQLGFRRVWFRVIKQVFGIYSVNVIYGLLFAPDGGHVQKQSTEEMTELDLIGIAVDE